MIDDELTSDATDPYLMEMVATEGSNKCGETITR
jgi:hypothetical protein